MAFKVITTKKFEKSAAKTSRWIEKEWSLKASLKFDKRIENVLDELAKNPTIGRISLKKDIRSLSVTRHNRIYFRVSEDQITILDLFETKTNPERNKYE